LPLTYNLAGYCHAKNEKEICELLEDHIYQLYSEVRKEYPFDTGCIIDYFGLELFTGKPILIEVKNRFLSIKDAAQLLRYYLHATEKYGENKFALLAYVVGCDSIRQRILEKLGVEVYIIKDMLK
jgi:hypothetical protein